MRYDIYICIYIYIYIYIYVIRRLKVKAVLYFQTSGSSSLTLQRRVPEVSNCQLHRSDDVISGTVL